MNALSLVSLAHTCGQTGLRYQPAVKAAEEMGLRPALVLDDRPYYAGADVDRLLQHLVRSGELQAALREQFLQQKD